MDRSEWGDDEAEPTRPPLPPEDRVWRHPSEMGSAFVGSGPSTPGSGGGTKRPVVLVAVAAGVLLLVAAGVAVRILDERAPSLAAAQSLATTVSLSRTSASTTTASSVDGEGMDVRVEATLKDGKRTSHAVVVDSSTMVTTIAAVAGATKLVAMLPEGRRLAARLVAKDARSGIALIRVSGARLDDAETGSAVPLRNGEKLWMKGEVEPGTITALGRSTTSPDGSKLRHVIRLDVDERKAREGMALVDADGLVVALCTRNAEGAVVGIPIDLATSAARSLQAHGSKLVLPWLGVTGRDADPSTKAGLPDGAAILTGVDAGGPAAVAGLLAGDVVVALADTKVTSISNLVLAARAYDAGDGVTISIVRDGQPVELTLVLGQLS